MENKEKEAKKDNGLAAKVRIVEKKLERLHAWLETIHGVDIDGDGMVAKITDSGKSAIGVVVMIAMIGLVGSALWATTRVWAPVNDGDSATMGTCKVDSDDAGTCTLTVDAVAADALDLDGDIVLVNGATIDEATDQIVRVTYEDSGSAQVGTLKFESDNVVTNAADDDQVSITFVQYDSTTQKTTYAYIDLKSEDITGGTEDGSVVIRVMAGGATNTIATFDANGLNSTAYYVGGVAGATMCVTNMSTLITNKVYYVGGLMTSNVPTL